MSKFKVIYADPNWSFDDKGSRIAPDHDACGDGYRTMSTDDICKLQLGRHHVSQVVEDSAALFLWTTNTHLLQGDAQRVIEAWGFTGKTIVPWVKLSNTPGESKAGYKDFPTVEWVYDHGMKIQIGAGHYVRSVAEQLILATRGNMVVPAGLRIPGVIVAPRTTHSAKPHCVYDMIDRLYPSPMRKLELFARDVEDRQDWLFFGDQARRE